ncbi:uncharacterized protein PpBr36_11005, partial [Pyricularia pennisetigena]|uniref:uncharacterized protein n=1 Tax=Pyricularia pennisetigena TaxID=1578925 RepID=UPI001151FAD3
ECTRGDVFIAARLSVPRGGQIAAQRLTEAARRALRAGADGRGLPAELPPLSISFTLNLRHTCLSLLITYAKWMRCLTDMTANALIRRPP